MKALIFDGELRFAPALAEPTAQQGEALIGVRRAGICATDLEITRGYMDFRGVLGHEFVGVVLDGSPDWKGKRVVGEINCVCGNCDMCRRGIPNHCRNRTVLGIDRRHGAFAERLTLPEKNLHQVPDGITDAQAVFAEPLAAACQILQQFPFEPRTAVAVLGSGRLGLLVAQVLQQAGCRPQVIGRNAKSLALCDTHGIHALTVGDLTATAQHDVVVDCSGSPQGLRLAIELVRPRGTILLKSTHAAPADINLAPVVVKEISVLGSRCGPFREAIARLARRQIEVDTLITGTFPLEKGVEAMEAARRAEHIKVHLNISDR